MPGNLKSDCLGKKLKGGVLTLRLLLRKKKKCLLQEFDILHVFSEKNLLSDSDNRRMRDIKHELDVIWRKEETAKKLKRGIETLHILMQLLIRE